MVEKVIEIAREAGEIIREGFGTDFSVEFKTSASNLVTEIDKKSEHAIISYIHKNFPSHTVLAEESGKHFFGGEYLWVIDPLDGTTNFAHGLPIFSVSIGVLKNDEIVAGVVYDVMNNLVYSAEKGSGAFKGNKKLNVSSNNKIEESLLVTGFPYDIKENPGHAIEHFVSFLTKARAVRRLGSAALDMCYVASGVFDGFWEVNLQPWDVCAGKLLVEEAGGIVTNFKNEKTDIFSKQILATNNQIQNIMLEILNKSI